MLSTFKEMHSCVSRQLYPLMLCYKAMQLRIQKIKLEIAGGKPRECLLLHAAYSVVPLIDNGSFDFNTALCK